MSWTIVIAAAAAAAAALFMALPLAREPAGERGARACARCAAVLVSACAVAAVSLYLAAGDPHAPAVLRRLDAVLAQRAADSPERLHAVLLERLAARPADARARVILARLELNLGRTAEAAASFERAIAASPKAAKDPQVLAELADTLGVLQGGALAGRPAALAQQALQLDPDHPKALELAGSAAVEAGDYRGAIAHWQRLLALLPADSPRRAELQAALRRIGRLADLQYPEPTRR